MKKCIILLTVNCIVHSFSLSAQFLSIAGTVNQGTGTLGNGIVFAINRSNTTTKIDKITSGAYLADSVLKGNYIVYAIPNPSNKAYLPTYFLNKQNPNQANSFDLVGHASEVDVYLLQKTTSESGNSTLNLRFFYENFNSDAGTDFARKWFALPTPPSVISVFGPPCQTLPVLLYNQQNQIIDWGITDNEGYVQFNNLAGGTYYAIGQRYDYVTQSGGFISIAANTTQDKSLWLTRNIATAIEDANVEMNLRAYPNPFQNELSLSGSNGPVIITDLTGGVYYTNSSFGLQTLPTTNWPKGIYLLRSGDKVHKVLKY